MNFKMIGKIISLILGVEAVFMLPSVLICAMDGDMTGMWSFIWTILIVAAVSAGGIVYCWKAPKGFYAREGLICVGVSWIIMSMLGCLPFVFSGSIPHYIDALFEMVSGFTTTGASILTDVEALSRGILYWRSFSHWLGGMGVLVFLLAIVPLSGRNDGFTMHLLRAESPGPDVGKLVPRMRNTAMILYLLYIALTVLNVVFLLFGGMNWFEALCTAYGTAGTGGFGVKNDSIASYSPYIQNVTTIFMLLFGVNFTCYYLVMLGHIKNVLKDEELRLYVGVVLVCIALIALDIRGLYETFGETLRHAAFQVGTIITTTGFATTDFDLWPGFSKSILLFLMVIGACAGSTGGGFKCGRALILLKGLRRNIRQVLHPKKVQVVRINNRVLSERVLDNTNAYLAAYIIIIIASVILISFDEFSVTTNLSAVLACFNNIGPGLEAVGPTCNYSSYSYFSKMILIWDMLAGRLEIFPILVLFSRNTWRHWNA